MFSGRILAEKFSNPQEDFYILSVVLDGSKDSCVVKGTIPGCLVHRNAWLGFEGRWIDHPKYGRQIQITRAPVFPNGWDVDTVKKIMVSSIVSSRAIQDIVDHVGEDHFLDALGDIETLKTIPGLSEVSAIIIFQRWESIRAVYQATQFLNTIGVPPSKVRKVWAHFGERSAEVLSKNPWELMQIEGITFEDADAVARNLNLDVSPTNLVRIRGAVLHALRNDKGFGHVYSGLGDITGNIKGFIPDVSIHTVAEAVKSLKAENLVVVDKTTRPGTYAIYDHWSYRIEKEAADLFLVRLGGESAAEAPIQNFCDQWAKDHHLGDMPTRDVIVDILTSPDWVGNVKLSALQVEGLTKALLEPVSVIAGLPGTGKTKSLQTLVRFLQDAGVPVHLAAPTGIAAKKLMTVTGHPAQTLHRMFEADGGSAKDTQATYIGVVKGHEASSNSSDGSGEQWGHSETNPHKAKVLIVDETSMVDAHVMYRILSCTRPDCKLVFVGDAAQLPSVGPGNVLRDLIQSGVCPTVSLTEIFRQDSTSKIVYAAHDIHAGRVPETEQKGDFCFVELPTEEDVQQTIVRLALGLYEKNEKREVEKRESFQVISPRHQGPVGVTTLNDELRKVLNPPRPGIQEMKLGSDTLREGDRIMIVKNSYDLGIYNGDVGKIESFDMRNSEVVVKIFGTPSTLVGIKFPKVASLLRLAYAITCHKCQGQEYDIILLPLVMSFRSQLQRNLLYTAVTRAKKRVFILGQHEALRQAVLNDQEVYRNTLFLDRIRGPQPA